MTKNKIPDPFCEIYPGGSDWFILQVVVQWRRRIERQLQINEYGTVIIANRQPDIGGSRASIALMAAETLGIDYHQIRSIAPIPR